MSSAAADAIMGFFAGRGKRIPNPDDDLFESELIDSMELLELVMHLEKKLGVEIDQELMSVDNFRSVTRIVETISRTS